MTPKERADKICRKLYDGQLIPEIVEVLECEFEELESQVEGLRAVVIAVKNVISEAKELNLNEATNDSVIAVQQALKRLDSLNAGGK